MTSSCWLRDGFDPIIDGWNEDNGSPIVVGYAPPAPRQSRQEHALYKSAILSVEKWIALVQACVKTATWRALVDAKGEYRVDWNDVERHFSVPQTDRSGAVSVVDVEDNGDARAECIILYAKGGSVVETYNCVQNMVNHHRVPKTAHVFFQSFSVCQTENVDDDDDIENSLILLGRIVEQNPKHGIFVVYTKKCDAYSTLSVAKGTILRGIRMGSESGLKIRGLFDLYRWTENELLFVDDTRTVEVELCDTIGNEIRDMSLKMRSELVAQNTGDNNPPLLIEPARQKEAYEPDIHDTVFILSCATVCTGGLYLCCLCCEICCYRLTQKPFDEWPISRNVTYITPFFYWMANVPCGDSLNDIEENLPPMVTRIKRRLDWVKTDRVTEKTLLERLGVQNHSRSTCFRSPVISREVKWKFENEWRSPGVTPNVNVNVNDEMISLPMGKLSYPFGRPFRNERRCAYTYTDACAEICCGLVGAPFHLAALFIPCVGVLTPTVRCCPPQQFYSVLLGCDGDCDRVPFFEKRRRLRRASVAPASMSMERDESTGMDDDYHAMQEMV